MTMPTPTATPAPASADLTAPDTAAVIPEPDGNDAAPPAPDDIIRRLRAAAGHTEPWHIALLNAVGAWNRSDEHYNGRHWRYIIGGEALDWLALAQRLCLDIPHAVPPYELEALLFHGRLPENITPEQFRRLIGPYRYTAHLNYWYGVVVEEALQLVVEEAVRKRRYAGCYLDSDRAVEDETFCHLYGATRSELAREFLAESHGAWGGDPERLSLTAGQEFTYRLFKRRMRRSHPARVASDTRRGLEKLRELRGDDAGGYAAAFVPGTTPPAPALAALTATGARRRN